MVGRAFPVRNERVYIICLPSNVGQLEVDLVADLLHRRDYQVYQAVSRVRAFAHDVRLKWYALVPVLVSTKWLLQAFARGVSPMADKHLSEQ